MAGLLLRRLLEFVGVIAGGFTLSFILLVIETMSLSIVDQREKDLKDLYLRTITGLRTQLTTSVDYVAELQGRLRFSEEEVKFELAANWKVEEILTERIKYVDLLTEENKLLVATVKLLEGDIVRMKGMFPVDLLREMEEGKNKNGPSC